MQEIRANIIVRIKKKFRQELYGWGSKFGTTNVERSIFRKFQNCEY